MEGEGAWLHDDLPEDLILRILALLPIRSQVKMRSVCKRWNHLLRTRQFQELYKTIPPSSCSTTAFCIQEGGWQLWVIMPELNTDAAYKLPSMPMVMAKAPDEHTIPSRIRLAANSICGSWLNKKDVDYTVFFLCNPATASWRILPRPSHKFVNDMKYSLFYAIGFPASSNGCTLVVGKCIDSISTDRTEITIEVYDSECNTWADPIYLSFDAEDDIFPVGRGFYSEGRFIGKMMGKGGQVWEFSVGEPHLKKLPLSVNNLQQTGNYHNRYSHHINSLWPWKLSGTDDKLVLANVLLHSIWMLNKETRGEDGMNRIINKWIQLPIELPHPTYNVAVNRNGQILVVGKSIWIYNQEGERVKTIEVSEIELKYEGEIDNWKLQEIVAFPFECNNLWWP
ncbi:hypothetical protein KI387_037036 [Taxus chinensis]|uniref:F-box domain-containing protein n=1 Tax=Taxus chinensis TaxID=29808 RepID=A0AA38L3H9_TAXCH|nr:hypothetical protein KI387_037036 [Taxus chinensis]